MDFGFSEEQEAVRDLARQIVEGQLSHEKLQEHRDSGEPFPAKAWQELAKSELVGIGLPEDVGGSGLGLIEMCLVLEELGRAAGPVPYLATVLMGALPVARFGTAEQKQRWLPGVVAGDAVLTGAYTEAGAQPLAPATTARREGDGWRLDGVKICVPFGEQADAILVSAQTGEGSVGLFLVEPGADGVAQEALVASSGLPETRLELSGVTVGGDAVVGDPSANGEALEWVVERVQAGLCAIAIGVCDSALRLTAEYTKTREQFERPIATFQAVAQRAADAYIDTEGIRLTAWQAIWRLSEELPASEHVAVAKFWAAEGGQRVVHTAQHLHGGIGVDKDYPLHRYFLWAKWLELTLGGATPNLLALGKRLAEEPV